MYINDHTGYITGLFLSYCVYIKFESVRVPSMEEHHNCRASNDTPSVHFADGGFD